MLQLVSINSSIRAKLLVALVPLSVLKPHEAVIEDRVRELLEDIKWRGAVLKPVVADFKTMVILDGHHRVEALKRLGASYVPALLVDYDSDCVSVSSWRKGVAVSKEMVREAGLSGKLLPPKTSRHVLCFEVPEVRIGIEMLVD